MNNIIQHHPPHGTEPGGGMMAWRVCSTYQSLHRPIMCAKCLSRAISSSVMFTMPRSFLNSAGTCLFAFGSSIDSVMNDTTICFCSRVMPRSSAAYGAIGVSLILCANVVIILTFFGFTGAKLVQAESNGACSNCRGAAESRTLLGAKLQIISE